MKLKRFQLALNHDDPLIVIKGLNEFNNKIIEEYNINNIYGYYGRGINVEYIFNNNHSDNNDHNNNNIKGLLLDYLTSSPQIEELFVLWRLTARNNIKDLIISHTKCISIILYCAKSDIKCCERIVTKILSEFTRSLTNQLTQGDIDITHCTLGLFISMCSSTIQNSRDTYHKLLSHLSPLQTLLQKGRYVSTNINGQQIQTDSRLLIIIIVLNLLYHSDVLIGNELLVNKGLFNRVVNGMSKDNPYTIQLILHGSIEILKNPLVPISIKISLIDVTYLQKILAINDEDILEKKKQLLELYVQLLVEGNDHKKNIHDHISGDLHKLGTPISRMTMLIKMLSPHNDLFHRKLVTIFLQEKTFLLIRCMDAIPVSWDEPTLSPLYISSLSYLCYLLEFINIDETIISTKNEIFFLNQSNNLQKDQLIKSFVSNLCSTLLPSNLSKKDISRLLQHKNPLLKRMGLILCLRVIQRIEKSIQDISPSHSLYLNLQSHLTSTLANILPDVQLLFSLRSRFCSVCVKYVFQTISDNSEIESQKDDDSQQQQKEQEQQKEDDNESNKQSNDNDDKNSLNEKLEFEQSSYFLNLILILLEKIFKTLPYLIPSQYPNFDVTKLLDDIFPWPLGLTTNNIYNMIKDIIQKNDNEEIYSKLLNQTLKVLYVATINNSCNWFGMKSDCIKLITNLLVTTNYDTLKKSSFQKLILLSCLQFFSDSNDDNNVNNNNEINQTNNSDNKLKNSIYLNSQKLMNLILTQSELFQGHELMNIEMFSEKNAWIRTIQKGFLLNNNFILLFDILLKISFHWNIELCHKVIEYDINISDHNHNYSFKNGLISFSPLFFSSLLFLTMDFSLFIETIPKFIQTHIENISKSSNNESSLFFTKYIQNIRIDLEKLICQVTLEILPYNTNPFSYLYTLSTCTDILLKDSIFSNFFSIKLFHNIENFFKLHDKQQQKQQQKQGSKNSKKIIKNNSWLNDLLNNENDNINLSEIIHENNLISLPILTKILLESNNIFDDILHNSNELLFLNNWWCLITSIIFIQGKEYLSLSFLVWLSSYLDKVMNHLFKYTNSEMIEILIFSIKCINELSSSILKLSLDEKWKIEIEEIINKFLFIIIEVIRLNDSPTLLISSLNSLSIIEYFLNETPLTLYYRQIITTTAICLWEKIQNQSKYNKLIIQDNISIKFWESICQIFSQVNINNENNMNNDNNDNNLDLFCLSWLLLSIVQDSKLKTLLINYCLNCKVNNNNSNNNNNEGYALTTLAQEKNIQLKIKKILIQIPNNHIAILKSGGIESLYDATQNLCLDYIKNSSFDNDENNDNNSVLLLNSLCGVSYELGSNNSLISYTEIISLGNSLNIVHNLIKKLLNENFQNNQRNKIEFLQKLDNYFSLSSSCRIFCNNTEELCIYKSHLPDILHFDKISWKDLSYYLFEQWCDIDNSSIKNSSIHLIWNTFISELIEYHSNENKLYLLNTLNTIVLYYPNIIPNLLTLMLKINKLDWNDLIFVYLIPLCLKSDILNISNCTNWIDLFYHSIIVVLDEYIHAIKDIQSNKLKLNRCCETILLLLTLQPPSSLSTLTSSQINESMISILVSTYNKFIKSSLKYGIENITILNFLYHILNILSNKNSILQQLFNLNEVNNNNNNNNSNDKILLLTCPNILEMIVSHSKFIYYLQSNEINKTQFLRLLLTTLSISVHQDIINVSITCLEYLMQSLFQIYKGTMQLTDRLIFRMLHLSQTAVNNMNSKLNNSDNSGSDNNNNQEKQDKEKKKKLGPIFSNPLPQYVSKLIQPDDFIWVTQAITPPIIYNSLTMFPFQRSFIPAIFYFEPTCALQSKNNIHISQNNNSKFESNQLSNVNSYLNDNDDDDYYNDENKNDESDIESNSNSEDNNYNSDENNDEDEDDDSIMDLENNDNNKDNKENNNIEIDWCNESSNSLDPSYWLPAIHFCLVNCEDLSMRTFANCGALAFVIAALGSECCYIRVYARSCLNIVYTTLLTQTPDKDRAFRERPQLLLLVTFIRNFFTNIGNNNNNNNNNDNNGDDNNFILSDKYRIPLSQSIFLARAALHLLQPQHHLYSSINKYLLSRPYCDIKDIPLYDLLVMESDIQIDQLQRLTALRLIRDSLVSNDDHLNMCRKNAYPRLMLLFSLFIKDFKIMHTILDIIEKSLCNCSPSARYLLERCALIPWFQQLSSPLNINNNNNSNKLNNNNNVNNANNNNQEDNIEEDKNNNTEVEEQGENNQVIDEIDNLNSNDTEQYITSSIDTLPIQILVRILILLRKSLGVLFLLSSKGLDIVKYIQKIYITCLSIIRDIILLNSLKSSKNESNLSFEFFKQLTLLIWDLTTSISTSTTINKEMKNMIGIQWSGCDIIELTSIIRNMSLKGNLTKLESYQLELSLFGILSFNEFVNYENISPDSISHILELSLFNTSNISEFNNKSINTFCLLSLHNNQDSNDNNQDINTNNNCSFISYDVLNSIYIASSNLINHEYISSFLFPTASDIVIDPKLGKLELDDYLKCIDDRNWKIFNELKYDITPLPTSLGTTFMINLCVRFISNYLSLIDKSKISNNYYLLLSRWSLIMKKIYYDRIGGDITKFDEFSDNMKDYQSYLISKCQQSILSSCDIGFNEQSNNNNNSNNSSYNNYIFGYYLTIISLSSMLNLIKNYNPQNNNNSNNNLFGLYIFETLKNTFKILIGISNDDNLLNFSSNKINEIAYFYWNDNSNNNSQRVKVLNIIMQSFDIISILQTLFDNKLNTMIHILHEDIDKINSSEYSYLNNVIFDKLKHLLNEINKVNKNNNSSKNDNSDRKIINNNNNNNNDKLNRILNEDIWTENINSTSIKKVQTIKQKLFEENIEMNVYHHHNEFIKDNINLYDNLNSLLNKMKSVSNEYYLTGEKVQNKRKLNEIVNEVISNNNDNDNDVDNNKDDNNKIENQSNYNELNNNIDDENNNKNLVIDKSKKVKFVPAQFKVHLNSKNNINKVQRTKLRKK